ncbi:unnamed protein product [Protopolystoma xenopodis]|uniref:2-oxoglutarate dehydrogenase E1 component/KDG C-terminal domain-containing protein n=1 Tax=Protopolystoma xenopodis TaxID=117903 RepID=A0A3S5CPK5_9PLAT|nr:unnamed protein product [Protopolystoma xenopodis]
MDIYYELVKERESVGRTSEIAISRVEQLTPFPYDLIKLELEKYPNAVVQWVQEEHKNMGPWVYIQSRINHLIRRTMPERRSKRVL